MNPFLLTYLRDLAFLLLFLLPPTAARSQQEQPHYPHSNTPFPYVSFSNGTLPYRVQDKWGFIDRENRIVMEPQFDSLFHAGEGYCLAVGSGGTKLIRQDMTVISDFSSFTGNTALQLPPQGSAGLKVRYLMQDNGYEIRDAFGTVNYARLFFHDRPGMHIFKDFTAFQRTVEEYRKPGTATAQGNRIRYTGQSLNVPEIDSVILSNYKDSSFVTIYPRTGRSYSIHGLPPYLESMGRYIYWTEYYTEGEVSKTRSYLVNLLTADLLKIEGFYYEYSSPDGKYHFYQPAGRPGYSLFDEQGRQLFSSPHMFAGFAGSYIAEYYGEYPLEHKRMIRLPDFSVFATRLEEMSITESGRFMVLLDDKRHLKIYTANEKLIFDLKLKKRSAFYNSFYILKGPGYDLLMTGRNKRQEVYSSSGRLLYSKRTYHDISFLHEASTFVFRSEDGRSVGIYLAESDSVQWMPEGSNARPVAPGKMFSYPSDSVLKILDFKGRELMQSPFSEITLEECFIGIRPAENASWEYYDMDLNPIMPGKVAFMKNLQLDRPSALSGYAGTVIAFSDRSAPHLYGIMSGDFRVIIPPGYSSIELHPNGRYYIVITPEGKTGYVRLDGTELWE